MRQISRIHLDWWLFEHARRLYVIMMRRDFFFVIVLFAPADAYLGAIYILFWFRRAHHYMINDYIIIDWKFYFNLQLCRCFRSWLIDSD